MIRICLKCNAYYADESLAFCLLDGTPLFNLDPSSDHWSEGLRVTKEKEKALRKQTRKLKLRRVLMKLITTMIVTMVVCVLVANSYIYLKPGQEENLPATPLIPATTTIEPSTSPAPLPTPTTTSTTSPTPECSETDKSREAKTIKSKYENMWLQTAKADPPMVSKEATPIGVIKPELRLRPLEIKSMITSCTSASIMITYFWDITTNFNGKQTLKTVEKKRRFDYVKSGGLWRPR